MIPTTDEPANLTQTAADDSRTGITDDDVVRAISPRGLELLDSLNTAFDTLVNEAAK